MAELLANGTAGGAALIQLSAHAAVAGFFVSNESLELCHIVTVFVPVRALIRITLILPFHGTAQVTSR